LHSDSANYHAGFATLGEQYKQHHKASEAHFRKVAKFRAIVKKYSEKGGDQNSLSNKVAFDVYSDNQRRLEKCELSAAHAGRMFVHLDKAWPWISRPRVANHDEAEKHRQIALRGALYKWPPCGLEPF